VWCVTFSPTDPNLIASGSLDKNSKIKTFLTGECLSTIGKHSERSVSWVSSRVSFLLSECMLTVHNHYNYSALRQLHGARTVSTLPPPAGIRP